MEDGLAALDTALGFAEMTGIRDCDAERLRLKGELLLQMERASHAGATAQVYQDAEACFLQAIELARSQSARSLELRAAISLSRLWRDQGRGAEAMRVLAECYNWFGEGFDTPDLIEARALLAELTSSPTP